MGLKDENEGVDGNEGNRLYCESFDMRVVMSLQ